MPDEVHDNPREDALNAQRNEQLEALFRHYGSGIGGFLRSRVKDPELAEELTARVFLTAVRRFHQLHGPAAAWLWSIVRSELAKHFRDRRLHIAPSADLPDSRVLPPEELERQEAQRGLLKALDRLPEEQQELVHMKFFLNLANLEIAAATGLTPSNVGVLVHRALKQLRAWMEDPAAPAARSAPRIPAPPIAKEDRL